MPSCKHGSHSQAAVLPATRSVTWFGGTRQRPPLIFPVCLHSWLSYSIFYERTPSFFFDQKDEPEPGRTTFPSGSRAREGGLGAWPAGRRVAAAWRPGRPKSSSPSAGSSLSTSPRDPPRQPCSTSWRRSCWQVGARPANRGGRPRGDGGAPIGPENPKRGHLGGLGPRHGMGRLWGLSPCCCPTAVGPGPGDCRGVLSSVPGASRC